MRRNFVAKLLVFHEKRIFYLKLENITNSQLVLNVTKDWQEQTSLTVWNLVDNYNNQTKRDQKKWDNFKQW